MAGCIAPEKEAWFREKTVSGGNPEQIIVSAGRSQAGNWIKWLKNGHTGVEK
jgi:hypothetical protein